MYYWLHLQFLDFKCSFFSYDTLTFETDSESGIVCRKNKLHPKSEKYKSIRVTKALT